MGLDVVAYTSKSVEEFLSELPFMRSGLEYFFSLKNRSSIHSYMELDKVTTAEKADIVFFDWGAKSDTEDMYLVRYMQTAISIHKATNFVLVSDTPKFMCFYKYFYKTCREPLEAFKNYLEECTNKGTGCNGYMNGEESFKGVINRDVLANVRIHLFYYTESKKDMDTFLKAVEQGKSFIDVKILLHLYETMEYMFSNFLHRSVSVQNAITVGVRQEMIDLCFELFMKHNRSLSEKDKIFTDKGKDDPMYPKLESLNNLVSSLKMSLGQSLFGEINGNIIELGTMIRHNGEIVYRNVNGKARPFVKDICTINEAGLYFATVRKTSDADVIIPIKISAIA